jgi:acyl-CoA thioesterase-1
MRLTTVALFVLLLAGLAAGCGDPDPPAPVEANRTEPRWEGVIAAVGDSLTEGLGVDRREAYPARLQERLLSAGLRYRVLNAGIGGETSSGALARIDWVLTTAPDIVVLETGANDGLRGLSPAALADNIDAIIARLKDRNIVVVLAGMKMVRNLGDDYVRAFEAVYVEMAAKHQVPLIPFFLEGVAGEPSLNLPDGIHPNADGYRRIADTVFPYVKEAIEMLNPTEKASS